MQRYTNRSKQLKQVLFETAKGEKYSAFIKPMKSYESKDKAVFVGDGVKVDAVTKTKQAKDSNQAQEGKE